LWVGDSIGKNRVRGEDFLEVIKHFVAREVRVSRDILPNQLDQ